MKKQYVIGAITVVVCCCLFAQKTLADTHWLEFNSYGYTTEFFYEGKTRVGSCGAAAVVLVENHLRLGSYIGTDDVKNKNSRMKLKKTGIYYIASVFDLVNELQYDGYTVVQQGTTDRVTAAKRIFDALAKKHWVIIVACHAFNANELGHYYPIYGGNLVTAKDKKSIDESSTLKFIEDWNTSYDPKKPNWSVMYQSAPLKKILDGMKSASSSTKSIYNIIEVSH